MRYKERLGALKRSLCIDELDALLITRRVNIIYLCGFEGDGSCLIVTPRKRDILITDPRFKEEAYNGPYDLDIRISSGSRYAAIDNITRTRRIRRLGFEEDHLSYNAYTELEKTLKRAKPVPKRGLVERLRAVKDNEELALIKKSVTIAKKGYLYAKKNIRPTLDGEGLAVLMDNFMRNEGSSRPPFQTIVAQNPYSSRPHAAATNIPFGRNSAVLIDTGAVVGGYNSDLTRMLFLGRISNKFIYIYKILKAAQKKAFKKIMPGARISEIDKETRQHIANKGLGKYFLHSLGHGIGLQIHEGPRISKDNGESLRAGMVFTVEPGIYIEGWGGLRIEDMVLVTESGSEVLTDDIPK